MTSFGGVGSAVIIEDDDSTARRLALLLTTLGYSCDICSNIGIARERLEENLDANLILIDLQMPSFSVNEILEEIARSEFYRNVKVVAVTVDAAMVRMVKDTPVLIKPVGLHDLITLLGLA